MALGMPVAAACWWTYSLIFSKDVSAKKPAGHVKVVTVEDATSAANKHDSQ